MDKFEIVNFGPYRFIGKSVYVRSRASDDDRGSDDILKAHWNNSDWIFDELDASKDSAPDQPYKAALITWDAYNPEDAQLYGITVGKTQLLGYCVGRFMKAGAPVPSGFDYIDIPEWCAAVGWTRGKGHGYLDEMIGEKIDQSGTYKQASWRFMAEIFPPPDENGESVFGYYMSCQPLTEEELKESGRAE